MGCCGERAYSVGNTIENKDTTIKARINKQFIKQRKTDKYELKGQSKEELLISIAVNHKILKNKLKQSSRKETKSKNVPKSRSPCSKSSESTNF